MGFSYIPEKNIKRKCNEVKILYSIIKQKKIFNHENDIAMMAICSEPIHSENKRDIECELLSAAF